MKNPLEVLIDVKERLENINANLQNQNIPSNIHAEALKEIVPEILKEIEDSSKCEIIANGKTSTIDVLKVYESWFADLDKNPGNFYSTDSKEYNAVNSADAFIYYASKLE